MPEPTMQDLLQPSSPSVPSQFQADVAAAAAADVGSGGLAQGAQLTSAEAAVVAHAAVLQHQAAAAAAGAASPTEPVSAHDSIDLALQDEGDAQRVQRVHARAAERQAQSQRTIALYTQHLLAQRQHAAAAAAMVQGEPELAVHVPVPVGMAGKAGNDADIDGIAIAGGGSDDSMGGDAPNGIVGKRGHEAVEAGRVISARAKARSG